jgi:hypothetical protein
MVAPFSWAASFPEFYKVGKHDFVGNTEALVLVLWLKAAGKK